MQSCRLTNISMDSKKKYDLRGICLVLTLVFSFSGFLAGTIQAQEAYPNRPITLIIGYAPGGGTDLATRAAAEIAGKILGQPFNILNKAGGGGIAALTQLKDSKPDGYTIGVMAPGSAGVLGPLLGNVPYHSIEDFVPIFHFVDQGDGLLVRADSPWKTVKQLIDHAKNNPGKIRYATSGVGSITNLTIVRLSLMTGVKLVHVPYEGGQPAITALLGGHVEAAGGSCGAWRHLVESGQLRVLASLGERRIDPFPQVPTLVEAGYNIAEPTAVFFVGPKGLPEPVIQKLENAIRKATEDPGYNSAMGQICASAGRRGSQDSKIYMKQIITDHTEVIQKLGLSSKPLK